jgi:hypothetical protein
VVVEMLRPGSSSPLSLYNSNTRKRCGAVRRDAVPVVASGSEAAARCTVVHARGCCPYLRL